MKLQICDAYAGQDEVVIAFDGEFAEPGNPDGAIYGIKVFVTAETPDGRRFNHSTAFDLEDAAAERLVARVLSCGVINSEYWDETYSIYGSAAWQEEDDLRALAHASGALAGSIRGF